MAERIHFTPDGLSESEQHARERYDKRYKEGYHKDWESVSTPIKEFVAKHLETLQGQKVLDLGCGQGRNLLYMVEQGVNGYGVDISQEAVKQAQELFSRNQQEGQIVQASFYDLPFQNDSFKAVISSASLHDIPWEGSQKALAEIARVLQPDGKFLFYVKSTPRKEAREDGRVHAYSKEQIEQLARDNDLQIEEIEEEVREDTDFVDNKTGMWVSLMTKKQ